MKKLKKDMVKLGLILVVLFIILYLAIYFFELRGLALNLTIWGSLLVVVALSFSLFSLQRKRMSEVNDITNPDERITALLEFKSPSSECYEYISSAYVEKNDIDNAIKYMHLAMDLVSQGKPVNLRSDHELLKFHQEQFLRIQTRAIYRSKIPSNEVAARVRHQIDSGSFDRAIMHITK